MNCKYRQGKGGSQSACPAICAASCVVKGWFAGCVVKGWFAGCNNLRHMRLSGKDISVGTIRKRSQTYGNQLKRVCGNW